MSAARLEEARAAAAAALAAEPQPEDSLLDDYLRKALPLEMDTIRGECGRRGSTVAYVRGSGDRRDGERNTAQ